jgi:putative phage-type endonuclease
MEQGTDEWFKARLGSVTASRVSDVMAKGKNGGISTSRENYLAQLVAERLTNEKEETYTNAAMQWGTDQEPHARRAYEFLQDVDVEQVGFVVHPTIPMSGASPDGLVGDDGLVEFKCPLTKTHIKSFLNGVVERKYVPQMMWQMACTGRAWCDFVSYDPRMPAAAQMMICRLDRDDGMIAEMETAVKEFLAEVDDTVLKIEQRMKG